MNQINSLIEGLIFLSGDEGLTLEQILKALEINDISAVKESIELLKEEYDKPEHGIELVEYASRYKFVTKETVYPFGQKLFEQFKQATLSQAALETLAIIAYKQPVTRVEIEEIRGVNCEMMLKKLMNRGLIEAKDRLDIIGKPLLYTVTDVFLDTFQLETLEELPELPQRTGDEELFDHDKE
ncbi:MAG: SMC-Scp complex subunit ScpB [Faecalicoccus sp.]|nr:SMC-Scp complex subunit ScpB [Faecalicoccus sp.]